MEKIKNGVKNGIQRYGILITTILVIVSFVIGTFINPVLGMIKVNEDNIEKASLDRETMRGDIKVIEGSQKNMKEQLDRIEKYTGEILKELRSP